MSTMIAARLPTRLYKYLLIAGAIALVDLMPLPAQAQTPVRTPASASTTTSTSIPMYEGADRTQRLIDGAKREGMLTVYTSMAAKDGAQMVAGFEKKYGIKVALWRAGEQTVLQRVLTEARARHNEVDLITLPSPEMEALHREQLLQPAFSPLQQALIPVALPAHREWVGTRVNVYVQVYNTQKISRDELPHTYEDLLDPRWKGKLGIEAKGQEWFYVLLQTMGEEKGLRFFQELVAKNGVSVRSGMTLLSNMIASGEVPFGLTVYSYLAEQSKARGAPVDFITLSPTVAHTDGIGISRSTPHPYAAMLFYDYLLSDGQRMVAAGHGLTTNRRDQAALARFNPTFIDPALLLDHLEKWTQMYNDTLLGRTTVSKP